MYVISGSRHHNKEVTEATKPYAIFVSENKLKKVKAVDGELYKIVYQRDRGPKIGVMDGHYIRSGLGNSRHYNLIEKIEPTEVSVKILNTDGKQKGRDLVGENIGKVFPIVEVGTHETYKYIVEIEEEKVALSIDNVMFIEDGTQIEDAKNYQFIKYNGVTLFIDDFERGVIDYLCGIDVETNSRMYVTENTYEVIDKAVRVGLNASTLSFVDKEGLVGLHDDVVYGYGIKHLNFGLDVPVKKKHGRNHSVFHFYATTESNLKKIQKEIPKNFTYDKNNSVFYFNG